MICPGKWPGNPLFNKALFLGYPPHSEAYLVPTFTISQKCFIIICQLIILFFSPWRAIDKLIGKEVGSN